MAINRVGNPLGAYDEQFSRNAMLNVGYPAGPQSSDLYL